MRAGVASEGTEPAVDPEQMGKARAGGQAQGSAAQVGRFGCLDASLGGHERGAGDPEGVVPGLGADERVPAEPVEHAEAGEAKQPALGDIEAREGELGDLVRGENLMLGEDGDETTVPVGEGAQHDQRIEDSPSR